MSLNIAYSSDEEDLTPNNDVFGLSFLPVAKRPRVDNEPGSSGKADAAPHVLAEVDIQFLQPKNLSY